MIAVVLAGGLSTRMGGGDKGFLAVGGQPILARVVATLRLQCDAVVISANGDPRRFERFGCPVIADDLPGGRGPLAGVLAGMAYVSAAYPQATAILTVPGDVPFLPGDLAARLEQRRVRGNAAIVRARSGERTHGVVALWSMSLEEDLRTALVDEDLRRVESFAARHATATVAWPVDPFDPFLNVNTPDDLAAACAAAGRIAVA